MKQALLTVLLFTMVALGPGGLSPQTKAPSRPPESTSDTKRQIEERVQQLLADEEADDDEAAATIFGLDHEVAPGLVVALKQGRNIGRAARSLAYVGGPEERRVLLAAIKGQKDNEKREELASLLAGALVDPTSKEEWAFLEDCLRGVKKDSGQGVVAISAALALGTNASRTALHVLEKGKSVNSDDDSAREIAAAIRWIRNKPASHNAATSGVRTDSDQIADVIHADAFLADGESKQPSIRRMVFTKDRMRVLASVEIYHGPKNAQGYDIVLEKGSVGAWKIVGIWFTWAA